MTTTQATRVKVWTNDATGYALTTVTDAYGVTHVTDTNGAHRTFAGPSAPADVERVTWELSIRYDARPYQAPAPTMASPLEPTAQVRPSNLSRGVSVTKMTDAQARAMRYAIESTRTAVIHRGSPELDGYATAPMLRAMERRGWLQLDDRVRPSYGRVTPHGRRALERYDTR